MLWHSFSGCVGCLASTHSLQRRELGGLQTATLAAAHAALNA